MPLACGVLDVDRKDPAVGTYLCCDGRRESREAVMLAIFHDRKPSEKACLASAGDEFQLLPTMPATPRMCRVGVLRPQRKQRLQSPLRGCFLTYLGQSLICGLVSNHNDSPSSVPLLRHLA